MTFNKFTAYGTTLLDDSYYSRFEVLRTAMQIGNLTLPDHPYRLPELLRDVAKIDQTFPKAIVSKARSNDKLAELLGYSSSRNGSYWNRLAALRSYRLAEGRPDLRLTELAKKLITTQNERERGATYFEAVCSIVLWRELYKRHKFSLPKENLWKDIAEIADCSPNKSRGVEAFVREAFEVDTDSIRTFSFEPPSGTMQIEIKAGPYYHRLPFTSEGLKAAIEILKAIKPP